MKKEVISNKEGICILTLFIMGSTLVLGSGGKAKQDVWAAILIGIMLAVPIILIYARILYLYPGKSLFSIMNEVFGKIIGNILSLLFVWYAFHLGALVIRNFSEFIKIAALPETPVFVPSMLLVLLCIWSVKEGIEVLGRWSHFVLPILISIILVIVVLSMSMANLHHLLPVLYDNWKPVFEGAFSVFSFPFTEVVVFFLIGNVLNQEKKVAQVYLSGLLIGGIFVLIIAVRNMLVMGESFVNRFHFPTYTAVSLINIGDFLQRIEILVSVVFLFAGFIKISICLLAVSKGIASILRISSYRDLVVPIGLLMMILSYIIYESITEMTDWAFNVYKFYAFPFQVILPLIIWGGVEIKQKRKNVATK